MKKCPGLEMSGVCVCNKPSGDTCRVCGAKVEINLRVVDYVSGSFIDLCGDCGTYLLDKMYTLKKAIRR